MALQPGLPPRRRSPWASTLLCRWPVSCATRRASQPRPHHAARCHHAQIRRLTRAFCLSCCRAAAFAVRSRSTAGWRLLQCCWFRSSYSCPLNSSSCPIPTRNAPFGRRRILRQHHHPDSLAVEALDQVAPAGCRVQLVPADRLVLRAPPQHSQRHRVPGGFHRIRGALPDAGAVIGHSWPPIAQCIPGSCRFIAVEPSRSSISANLAMPRAVTRTCVLRHSEPSAFCPVVILCSSRPSFRRSE
jgi:hypothetical protein